MELYIHIPFCARKCRYCDFASYAGCESQMAGYVDAVLDEASLRAKQLGNISFETVFIGGGTPSLLPASLLDKLLKGIREHFTIAPHAEFTCEANPGTLTEEWLRVAMHHGMNRLSMGMQAYQPELLNALGRIHTYEQVEQSVAMARAQGISNISLDLMFGLPGQTFPQWQETLHAALALHPQHLSCYGLIPEEGTPLKQDLDTGKLSLPDEDAERAMYDETLRLLASQGYQQYEISNFALPGYVCQHNLGYWQQVPYLGLGAAASSMLTGTSAAVYTRETNPASLQDYMTMVSQNAWEMREVLPITRQEARFETMMLGLRTTHGVSETAFAARHGTTLEECYGAQLRSLAQRGLMEHQGDCWRLTRRGMDVQNAILVELMDD